MITIKNIIEDAVQQVLLLSKDEIATDVRDMCLSVINTEGKIIFDAWPWDNSKLDEAVLPDSDGDGIVTFPSTVDVVRAIRPISSSSIDASSLFAEDEIQAAIRGEGIGSERFQYLSDDSSGNRRIKIATADSSSEYYYLALKRFVEYSALSDTDDDYDADIDYALVGFYIDRAVPALRSFVEDKLRMTLNQKPEGRGAGLLQIAINRETQQQQRGHTISPRYPMFSDAEDWRE